MRELLAAPRRTARLALLGCLALALSACGDDPDAPEADSGPVLATARAAGAATWLTGELKDGLMIGEYGPDYGLSIDAALGLAEVPGQEATVDAIATAVSAAVPRYTTGVDFGSRDIYAGSVAKVAVLAQASGADPTDLGGADVLALLERLVADDGATTGRLADEIRETEGADYANTIGQAYAVRALAASDSAETAAAAEYLLAQQCEPGWFRLYFAEADEAQGCGEGPRRLDRPDPDVTALAVIALQDVPGESTQDGVTAAVDWLVSKQAANGGFRGGLGAEELNSNSTGLAGLALHVAGREDEAARAADWVARHQVRTPTCGTGRIPTGAVAYGNSSDPGTLSDPLVRDEWRRATAQAAPLLQLVGEPVASLDLELVDSELRVSGLGDGERACLAGPGGYAEELVGTGETLAVFLRGTDAAGLVVRRLAGVTPVAAGS